MQIIQKNNYLILLKTVFSVTGIIFLAQLCNINFDGIYNLLYFPIIVFMFELFKYGRDAHYLNSKISYILGLALAIITILGLSFITFGNGSALGRNYLKSLIILSALTIFFEQSFQIILKLMDNYAQLNISKKNSEIPWKLSFFAILIIWILYLLPFLPGNTAGDGNTQLDQFFGYGIPMTNHHPYISTVFEGTIVKIGWHLISGNFGLFMYVVIQMLICCAIYSYCIYKVSTFGLPRSFSYTLIVIVGVLPYWSFVSETLHKDGLFIAFYSLFTLLSIEIVKIELIDGKGISKKLLIQFAISCLLVSFWRNNGIYCVLPTIILLIFVRNFKYWKAFLTVLAVVICIYIGFTKIALPILNVPPTEPREALSLPIQQTARYIKEHPKDIKLKEKKVLNREFKNYKNLGVAYDPNISDPTKALLKDNANVKAYLLVWLSMGMRHPKTYFEATFAGTYDYYYPWITVQSFTWAGDISTYHNPTFLNLHYLTTNSIRNAIKTILTKISDLPFINLLINYALLIWICLLMIIVIFIKYNYAYAIPFLSNFMNLLICIASPVNGNNRYSGCIVFATYCLIGFYLLVLKEGKQKNE